VLEVKDRVLLSFAHPDDESFFIAGTIRRYSESGAYVALVSATSGEQGSAGDPPVCSRQELGRVREAELRAAAEILGITEVHLLGFPDRGLASAPSDEVRSTLVAHLRRLRPSIVITFDPNGVNGHPDHVACGRFTMDAVNAAADARWHPEHGAPHEVERVLWTAPIRPYHMADFDDLASRPGIDFIINIRPWARHKAEALLAHTTQRGSVNRHFFDNADWEKRLSVEALRLGCGKPVGVRPARDIFEGLD
jgi:LmbE family N-acetylglucosaminyl deacetylase